MDKRHILTETDIRTLDRAKQLLSISIEDLKQDNLWNTVIEIELISHIKKELRKGGH